ncbi:MAG: hypothetical protein QM689_11355 [Oscillospiraceae bacterium]
MKQIQHAVEQTAGELVRIGVAVDAATDAVGTAWSDTASERFSAAGRQSAVEINAIAQRLTALSSAIEQRTNALLAAEEQSKSVIDGE